MRFFLLSFAALLSACATPPEPAVQKPIDPTVHHDFRVVPRAPDVALYPAIAEHVWVPVPADRVWVTVKVVNYPAQRPAPPQVVAVAPPVPSTSPPRSSPPPAKTPSVYTAEVRFAFDKHALDAQAKRDIEQLVQRVGASMSSAEIIVEGYTDSRGSDAYNIKLSQRRATAVRDYLISKGASSALVSVSGKGEASPADSNATEAGRSRNRRTTVQVTSD